MMIYMGLTGMTRALYIAENKDTSKLYTERVEVRQRPSSTSSSPNRRVIFAASTAAHQHRCRLVRVQVLPVPRAVPRRGRARADMPVLRALTPIGNGVALRPVRRADPARRAARRLRRASVHLALLERVAELVKADGNAVVWKNLLTGMPFDQPTYSSRDMATARDFA